MSVVLGFGQQNLVTNGVRTTMRNAGKRRDEPAATSQMVCVTVGSVRPVGVVELNVLVQYIPFLFPTPDGAAVYTAAVGYNMRW